MRKVWMRISMLRDTHESWAAMLQFIEDTTRNVGDVQKRKKKKLFWPKSLVRTPMGQNFGDLSIDGGLATHSPNWFPLSSWTPRGPNNGRVKPMNSPALQVFT